MLPCVIRRYPVLLFVTPCYPMLPFVTMYYPVLPHVTTCYPVLPFVTICYPLLPRVPLCYPVLRIRHRNELTERDWENAVQGLGKEIPSDLSAYWCCSV